MNDRHGTDKDVLIAREGGLADAAAPLLNYAASQDAGFYLAGGSGDDLSHYLSDFYGPVDAGIAVIGVARPTTVVQVSDLLRLCNAGGIPVVPQGGMTGLVGGALPIGPCLLLSLERMRQVEEIDISSGTMTVEAGVALETVQTRAEEAGMYFPLDLGARGSAQIGGNISTNAGGNRVLRYGMMRELVLGLEVVLADGTVLTMLNKMLKNNTGFDLKQLFIGAEGTLGVITRAVLRLHPIPAATGTALCALKDYDAVLDLLHRARQHLDLSAFEVMWPDFYHLGTVALDRASPIAGDHGIYVLLDAMGDDDEVVRDRIVDVISAALEEGEVEDAVIAQSGREAAALWQIRESTGELSRIFWPLAAFDISVPTSAIGAFVTELERELRLRWPELALMKFGHVADSDLHLGIRLDEACGTEKEVEELVYGLVGIWQGAISAEHGIGTHKRAYLHHSRSAAEVEAMRTLKRAFDPRAILNPGKILPE